jgi:hypothetical protein
MKIQVYGALAQPMYKEQVESIDDQASSLSPVNQVDCQSSSRWWLKRQQYQAMSSAYERTGGLISAPLLVRLMRERLDQPLSKLARWIVKRQIVYFEWNSEILVPLFQFTACEMDVQRPVLESLGELTSAFDEWEVATWFATENSWLDNQIPVDALRLDSPAVLHAARADRFIRLG